MKTREDYIIDFEVKLLDILKDLYKSVNYNFATAYGLSMLLVLVHWGSVSDINFLGANLSINRTDMLIFIPILISLIYILINYQLRGIAEVYSLIHTNAKELLSINKEAKPITMREIHLFGAGVTGLILSLSRWQAKRLLTNNPFKFRPVTPEFPSLKGNLIEGVLDFIKFIITLSNEYLNIYKRLQWIVNITNWFITTSVRSLIIVFLFLLPIIVAGYYEYLEFFYQKPILFGMPLLSLMALVLIAIYTIFNGLVLFATYLVDLLESFKTDFAESVEEIRITFMFFQEIFKSILSLR